MAPIRRLAISQYDAGSTAQRDAYIVLICLCFSDGCSLRIRLSLWLANEPLRACGASIYFQEGDSHLSPGAASRDRAVAFLDALLMFKVKNVNLIRALELGPGVLQSEHYKWMHGLLHKFIEDAALRVTQTVAIFAAHVLLAGLHIDLVEEMIAGGLSVKTIRGTQAVHVAAVIDSCNTDRN